MRRLSTAGVVGAAVGWIVAWLPSLLPSGTVFQGVSLGLCAAIGYGVGATAAAIASLIAPQRVAAVPDAPGSGTARHWHPSHIVAAISAALALLSGAWLVGGVNTQATQVGTPDLAVAWLGATAVGLAVFAFILAVARGLRALTAGLSRRLPHQWPTALRHGVSTATTVVVLAVVGYTALGGIRMTFDRIDADESGQSPPTSPTRSGSTESLIPFAELGRQGRSFVTEGQNSQTIRAYAGLDAASSAQARADLAVADMLRAGGAEAPIWIGITTTGNGFIDPAAADAADQATSGQAAMVAMQYSTLPSWLSFLVDQTSAQEAGTALFEALASARDQLPAEQRPRLILYGESLGAYGSAAPFQGMSGDQIAERIDGALWVGPPAATQPISDWTYSGSPPVWQPIIGDGRWVRYAATIAATEAPPGEGPWLSPRILVLQNPTDPVVWFSTSLAWRPAAWLADPRGPGVQPGTRWVPVLTFLEVALDLPQAVNMPSGYGHDYAEALPEAWQQVLADAG